MSKNAWELASGGKEGGITALFKGASVLDKKGQPVSVISHLKDRTVVLYFGAKWVGEPCTAFSKLLEKDSQRPRARRPPCVHAARQSPLRSRRAARTAIHTAPQEPLFNPSLLGDGFKDTPSVADMVCRSIR